MRDTGRQLKRIVVLATSALLIVIARIIPSHEPGAPLRVAVGLWPGSESLLEAQERGLLPESDFVFLEATWPSAAYRAFDNNAVDVAVLSTEDVARLRSGGENVRIICFMDESLGADALIAGPGVDSIAALKGKRVGVSPQGPGLHFLDEALATAGLKRSDIELVTLIEPDIPDSLSSGSVAAVVASEPWLGGILSGGGKVLSGSGLIKVPFYRLLVARESAVTRQRAALVRLLEAHFETAPILREIGRVGRQDRIPTRQGIPPESFSDIIGRIRVFSLEENLELMNSDLTMAAGVDSAVRVEGWVDDSLLKEVPR